MWLIAVDQPPAEVIISKLYTYDIPLTVTAFEAGLRRL
jgi:hypothetical protein